MTDKKPIEVKLTEPGTTEPGTLDLSEAPSQLKGVHVYDGHHKREPEVRPRRNWWARLKAKFGGKK